MDTDERAVKLPAQPLAWTERRPLTAGTVMCRCGKRPIPPVLLEMSRAMNAMVAPMCNECSEAWAKRCGLEIEPSAIEEFIARPLRACRGARRRQL